MDLTRRGFLAGIALGGAGALTVGVTGCAPRTRNTKTSADNADTTAEEIQHNPESTETCDIVVVGSGTAGMSAAARGSTGSSGHHA